MILKEIRRIFASMIICSVAEHLIITYTWNKKYYSVTMQKCFLWKETSTYWKFKDRIFKLFKAPNQHSCCVIVSWKFLPLEIIALSEWSIDSTAVFPCKTLAFRQKYISIEIKGMTLVVYKLYYQRQYNNNNNNHNNNNNNNNNDQNNNNNNNNNNNILILIIGYCSKPLKIDPSQGLI